MMLRLKTLKPFSSAKNRSLFLESGIPRRFHGSRSELSSLLSQSGCSLTKTKLLLI
ncbi:hypothetical protein CRYUN_Cryun28dG0061400 [Craigia yunnanensis]